MQMKDVRIVFMGSPEFAVHSLSALVDNGYNIVGVITSPDKPAGRGLKIKQSEIKKISLQKDLSVFQPENLKDPYFLKTLKELDPELQIIVGFRKLPKEIWSIPKYGTFNLHASFLPNYRGAAPIHWAIINGEKETGVTTFYINEEIDTGKILFRERVEIDNHFDAGILHDKLAETGAALVLKTTQHIIEGKIKEIDQEDLVKNMNGEIKKAPKICKEDCRINWNKDTREIYNFIRGLSPYPTAWTMLKTTSGKQMMLKVFSSSGELVNHDQIPGTLSSNQKTFLKIAVPNGYINILELQLEGKKRMEIEEFLRGNRVEEWKIE